MSNLGFWYVEVCGVFLWLVFGRDFGRGDPDLIAGQHGRIYIVSVGFAACPRLVGKALSCQAVENGPRGPRLNR